jgi:copper chaperone CopZ
MRLRDWPKLLLAFLQFFENLDVYSQLCIWRDKIGNARLAIGEMGAHLHLSIPSDMHIENCVKDATNKVLSIDPNSMVKVAIVLGFAVFVNCLTKTLLGRTNDVTTIEGDPDLHQVVLLALDGITRSDNFVE